MARIHILNSSHLFSSFYHYLFHNSFFPLHPPFKLIAMHIFKMFIVVSVLKIFYIQISVSESVLFLLPIYRLSVNWKISISVHLSLQVFG